MKASVESEWRAWIALYISIAVALVGAALGLFWRAEAYADQRVDDLRQEVCGHLVLIRDDVKRLHEDVRLLIGQERRKI